jgi:hypothetical protein
MRGGKVCGASRRVRPTETNHGTAGMIHPAVFQQALRKDF